MDKPGQAAPLPSPKGRGSLAWLAQSEAITLLRADDDEAWIKAIKLLRPRLEQFVANYGYRGLVRDDIVQDALTVLWEAIGETKAPIVRFVHTVCRNLCHDEHRSKRRGGGTLALTEALGIADRPPPTAAAARESIAAMRRQLARLPPALRVTMLLLSHGLTQGEIADCLGKSRAAIEKRVTRARAILRDGRARE